MKLVVADPKTGKTYQTELDEGQAKTLYGKKIKETVKGDTIGLPGYELQITGGSDNQGFPMRFDLHGSNRKRIMLSAGPGFHAKRKGERRRKSLRGNTISEQITQINTKVLKEGNKTIEKAFGKEEEVPKEETPKKEVLKEETPKKEEEKKETPKEAAPKKEDKPKEKETPKDEPKKEEKPAEKKETPEKEVLKEEKPEKDAPKKEEKKEDKPEEKEAKK